MHPRRRKKRLDVADSYGVMQGGPWYVALPCVCVCEFLIRCGLIASRGVQGSS